MRIKRTYLLIIGISLLLVVTNPTNKDFKHFIEGNNFSNAVGGRVNYFLFFSVYKLDYFEYKDANDFKVNPKQITSIGFFKNFISIKERKTNP